MNHKEELNVDEGLRGNEQIEEAIAALQQEPSQEMLAHTLTCIRRRMNENGQVIIAVEPPVGDQGMQVQAVQTDDGANWWVAFTGFEEEIKGSEGVMSTFLTDMGHLFTSACLYKRITGKENFLNIARKAADFLNSRRVRCRFVPAVQAGQALRQRRHSS